MMGVIKRKPRVMGEDFEKLIKVNVMGRVFVTCQTGHVSDPAIIQYYVEIVEQAVRALLTEESTASEFQEILDQQLKWLEQELDQMRGDPEMQGVTDEPRTVSVGEDGLEPQKRDEKSTSGCMPEAKSMLERLKDRRAIIEELLDNDCIPLKLATPEEVKTYKLNLLGKEPGDAEEELVAQLRNVLRSQIRQFILSHDGGPWASASQQHELRMGITRTRSLRALINLARALLHEREEWLQKAKGSLTGRLFGGRVQRND